MMIFDVLNCQSDAYKRKKMAILLENILFLCIFFVFYL